MESFTLHERASTDAPTNIPAAAIAIGTFLVLMLYGQAVQEAYHYFRRYPKDGYDLKALIALLLVFDTFHGIAVTHVCYSALVIASSDMTSNETTVYIWGLWSFWLIGPSAGFTLILSHCFFVRRVYKLGHQLRILKAIVVFMMVAATGLTIFYLIDAFTNKRPGSGAYIIAILWISLFLDIALTLRLVTYLWKSRTGIRSTDNIIDRLVSFSINTGLLTGLLTIIPGVLLAATPMSFAYYPISSILAPVHTSVVLAAVNSRRSLVDRGSEGIELRTFDLDVAPRQGQHTTIQWATRRSGSGAGDVVTNISVGAAPEVEIQLGPAVDAEEVRRAVKDASEFV